MSSPYPWVWENGWVAIKSSWLFYQFVWVVITRALVHLCHSMSIQNEANTCSVCLLLENHHPGNTDRKCLSPWQQKQEKVISLAINIRNDHLYGNRNRERLSLWQQKQGMIITMATGTENDHLYDRRCCMIFQEKTMSPHKPQTNSNVSQLKERGLGDIIPREQYQWEAPEADAKSPLSLALSDTHDLSIPFLLMTFEIFQSTIDIFGSVLYRCLTGCFMISWRYQVR